MTQPTGAHTELPGSHREPLGGIRDFGPVAPGDRAEVTVILRRRAEIPPDVLAGPPLDPAELAARYGADPADVDLTRTVLTAAGLTVTSADAASRRVKAEGTLADLQSVFAVTLRQVSSPALHGGGTVTHRYREGPLSVPAGLAGAVVAVLGLDTRPQARPHVRTRAGAAPAAAGYTAAQVAGVYKFPPATGKGQTVAVIELGGGYTEADLAEYCGQLGISVPKVTAVSVDGAANAPGSDPSGADVEVALDIDVIAGASPGAAIVVYFAPNNGDQGFVDAISDAAHASPAPAAISVSWGQSEDSWTAQGRSAMDAAIADAAAAGITVCVASGDSGSGDGVPGGGNHVDFPASSPHALGCGGTTLTADPSTGAIRSEVVWNETASGEGAGGGGYSDAYPEPAWQSPATAPAPAPAPPSAAPPGPVPDPPPGRRRHRRHRGWGWLAETETGRGVPDVAGNADPVTGYQVVSGGQTQIVGGTSAVAPLWAALVARLAESTGTRFGLITPALYKGAAAGKVPAGFRDVTSGSNGAFTAGPGWDACTGLGSPDGAALLTQVKP